MIWEIDDGPKAIEGLDAHGRADPAYAQALGLLPAPYGRRVLATVLELAILAVLALPGTLVGSITLLRITSGGEDPTRMLEAGELIWPIVAVAVSNALVTIFTIVQLVMHGRKGVTAGKAMVGIRSVNVRTLERPGFWRGAVVRYLLLAASFLVPLVGTLLVVCVSPLFDPERRGRGWLDLAAATWFVDVRRGLNPYDTKRMRIARKTLTTPEAQQKAPLPSLATPVDRDAPAAYVPSGRFSGGVVGAHRAAAPEQARPAGTPAPPAPAATSPATPDFAPPAASGMVDAVPPPLAHGQLLDGFASAPSPPPVAPAVAPAAADPAPPAPPQARTPTRPQPAAPDAVVRRPAGASATASGAAAAHPIPSDDRPGTAVRAVIVLDTGERVDVRGAALFGRAPAPVAGEGAVQLIQVADDTRSVSKTHLAILPARRGVIIVDRGSTNGSSLVRAGVETPLPPGDPAALQAGDIVRFGDRAMTVERA